MTHRLLLRRAAAAAALVALAACKDKAAVARGDSLQGQLTDQQRLSAQLAAQKDSLTRVVLDADAFIGQMDSAIKTVKGLPRKDRKPTDPLADQVQARKDMQERVNALVARAKATANQLAQLQKQQVELQSANNELKEQNAQQATKIEEDAQMIADLGATIERQRTEIATLSARIDSLGTEMKTLGTRAYKAYYVIGTEKELREKGVIAKEGGANLLFFRPGKTMVPARVLNADAFTAIDQREVKMIPVPDSTSKYRIVSRQSLDDADVQWRDAASFKGNLNITKPDEFWAPSKFLIIVKM
jgi:septal ring factor EnvC (AmiA/AmiB activator)